MALAWNLADLFELVADTAPERLALAHDPDGPTRTWAEMDRRTDAVARHLREAHGTGDKLAVYAHNRPEFVEALVAAMKARLVPVNVNYRYRDEELAYLFDNSDATVVVYEAAFAGSVARLRPRLPRVREWIEIPERPGEPDAAPGNDFALSFEALASGPGGRLDLERSPDDLVLLYTGGTTGMPKGVMWTQSALFRALGGGGNAALGEGPSESVLEQRARIADASRAMRLLPACPLMHGTGQFTAYNALAGGGAIVTCESRSLDPERLWRTVEARRVKAMAIVGDAFAKPMLRVLDEAPGRFDLSSLSLIVSSGVMWSPPVKQGLLRHLPHAVLMDSFGSSEAVGFGTELTTRDSTLHLGRFRLGPNCKVFTPEGKEVEPGSGEAGFIARSGPIPLGYYKDEKKSAETFPVLQGRRWSIPGDWCTVNPDGTLNLHGRGSVCINTGGEKVYPEEVEEALKLHEEVADAVVVGVPDETWGEAVTALVALRPGAGATPEALRSFVKERLAAYKAPKSVVLVERVFRSPSGTVDYTGAMAHAREALGVAS
ncbi:MAG: acyl-CoA synthetase [Myxococcota bacterium]|nr:acyl-CoA synthetase [Myxococcota bacterium]